LPLLLPPTDHRHRIVSYHIAVAELPHHRPYAIATTHKHFICLIINEDANENMDDESRIVKLVSKEGDVHEVPLSIAKMSILVSTTVEEDDEDDDDDDVREIPLANVKNEVLVKIIDFCTHYKQEPMTAISTPLKSSKVENLVQEWYSDFCKVDQKLLFELVTAANFMDIKPLLDLTCLAVAVLIKVSD